jgi:outer membrane protein
VLAAADPPALQNRPIGDLGLGAYTLQSIVRGNDDALMVLPYAFIKYARAFARQDTLGVKTFPAGYGHLELVARINFDGFDTDAPELRGLASRSHSMPLGIGTFQITPVGGLFLNAFHDVNDSGGNSLEAIYGAKVTLGNVAAYPLLGAEYRDAKYVRYYYGVSKSESAASGTPEYQPGGAFNPMAAVQVEIPITETMYLIFYWRRLWLDTTITDSPIIARTTKDTGFAAVSYRFE